MSDTVEGHKASDTAMEQSILDITSRSSKSKQQKHVLQAKPPPEQLPKQPEMKAAAVQVPLSPPTPWLAHQRL